MAEDDLEHKTGLDQPIATDEFVRKTGLEQPSSARQLISIGLILIHLFFFVFLLLPLLEEESRPICKTVFYTSWLGVAAASMLTMSTDPVDPLVESTRRGYCTESDYSCGRCRSNVDGDSRHCWACNKCVWNFDHHCPWLNTCIGRRNYVSFFITLVCCLIMFLIFNGVAIHLMWLECSQEPRKPRKGVMASLFGVVVLNFPLLLLVGSLLSLHCYLVAAGITTYEYITGEKPHPKSVVCILKHSNKDNEKNTNTVPKEQSEEVVGMEGVPDAQNTPEEEQDCTDATSRGKSATVSAEGASDDDAASVVPPLPNRDSQVGTTGENSGQLVTLSSHISISTDTSNSSIQSIRRTLSDFMFGSQIHPGYQPSEVPRDSQT